MISNQKNKSLLPIILSAGLIFLGFYFFNKTLSSLSIRVFSPIIKKYNEISKNIYLGFKFLEPKSFLIKENEYLKQRVSDMEMERIRTSQSSADSFELTTASSTYIVNTIEASAISFPPRAPYDTLLIDKGSSDLLHIGSKAFIREGIQIGTVESVSPSESVIRLFSSPKIETESVLLRTGEVVTLLGAGGNNFKVELPIDFDIQEGDIFVLPGEKKFTLAKVYSIKRDNTRAFASVLSALPLKIKGDTIIYVEI